MVGTVCRTQLHVRAVVTVEISETFANSVPTTSSVIGAVGWTHFFFFYSKVRWFIFFLFIFFTHFFFIAIVGTCDVTRGASVIGVAGAGTI